MKLLSYNICEFQEESNEFDAQFSHLSDSRFATSLQMVLLVDMHLDIHMYIQELHVYLLLSKSRVVLLLLKILS